MRASSLMFVTISAILFILFDLDCLPFPWAISSKLLRTNPFLVYFEMIVFLGILLLGYIYVWKKGALDWE